MALYEAVASGGLPSSEKWANVFHFTSNAIQPTAFTDIRDMLVAFYTAFRDDLTTGWSLGQIAIKDKATNQVVLYSMNIEGTAGGDNLPNEVALVVSWSTPIRTRRTRGRTFTCGYTESGNAGIAGNASRPAQTVITNLADAAAGLIAVTAAARLVVFSRTAGTSTEVNSGYVNNEWDTQRRRGRQLVSSKTFFGAV